MTSLNRARATLSDPKISASTLLAVVVDLFGMDVLQWDPETIRMELEEANGSDKLPEENFNKLMAAIEIVTSDSFYRDLPAFIRLCNALYSGIVTPGTFDPADVAEIAWGITEALLLWPPAQDEQEPFDHKIIEYIGHALRDEGIMNPPDVLRLGIVNGSDTWTDVQATFSDDPVMFESIYAVEKAKTDDINNMVMERLRKLMQELDTINLTNGNAKDAVQRMFGALKQEQED
jgi:hypothetical protein